jgi:hypothetical protein
MIELFNTHNFTRRCSELKLLLNSKHENNTLSAENLSYFEKVINAHHRSHSSTIFTEVTIKKNPIFTHNNFVCKYIRNGNIETDIVGIGSTLKAVPDRDINEIKRAKCIKYMRRCLKDDFKQDNLKDILLSDDNCCKICGCEITVKSCHLDHCGEFEFRHIAAFWLTDDYLNKIIFYPVRGGGDGFDTILKNEWIEFHDEIARYQLTCIGCNLRKSKL